MLTVNFFIVMGRFEILPNLLQPVGGPGDFDKLGRGFKVSRR